MADGEDLKFVEFREFTYLGVIIEKKEMGAKKYKWGSYEKTYAEEMKMKTEKEVDGKRERRSINDVYILLKIKQC